MGRGMQTKIIDTKLRNSFEQVTVGPITASVAPQVPFNTTTGTLHDRFTYEHCFLEKEKNFGLLKIGDFSEESSGTLQIQLQLVKQVRCYILLLNNILFTYSCSFNMIPVWY